MHLTVVLQWNGIGVLNLQEELLKTKTDRTATSLGLKLLQPHQGRIRLITISLIPMAFSAVSQHRLQAVERLPQEQITPLSQAVSPMTCIHYFHKEIYQ